MNKSILITGGTGSLGQALVKHILENRIAEFSKIIATGSNNRVLKITCSVILFDMLYYFYLTNFERYSLIKNH